MNQKALQYIERYGRDLASAIPILQAIQSDFGYLPDDLLQAVCETSDIHKNQLYGIATFYSQFSLRKKGGKTIKVCEGTACHVRGAPRVLQAVETELDASAGQMTNDGKYSIETVACLGCCSLAPVMMVGSKVYGKLTADEAKKVLHGNK
ncbi:MAG: NAD(P)H-dependent oxidoreductase subunit E [Candidatus Margulisiibacteriota bacterium]